ncbi:hypothetical protein DY000_02036373 [Brassica cretica]|uniref:Uncharacterized protein n=1 Tax=Brassica cretica TaxID=69181 RepID=A0ABQ7B8C8_BRACR|nr:hypothetical protein DY000_02036373 [Brassica cretica]
MNTNPIEEIRLVESNQVLPSVFGDFILISLSKVVKKLEKLKLEKGKKKLEKK